MGDRLKDKVALVSGAGSSGRGWGNGKATALLFAREGAKVLAANLNLDAAVETKRIIEREGGICEVVAGNVSRADDVAAGPRGDRAGHRLRTARPVAEAPCRLAAKIRGSRCLGTNPGRPCRPGTDRQPLREGPDELAGVMGSCSPRRKPKSVPSFITRPEVVLRALVQLPRDPQPVRADPHPDQRERRRQIADRGILRSLPRRGHPAHRLATPTFTAGAEDLSDFVCSQAP
jgi:hypothetical protein